MQLVARGLEEGLRDLRPELILSDFALPGYDGSAALDLAVREVPETPMCT